MSSNMALPITRDEWKEIEMLPNVQKVFEEELHINGYLSEKVYGAKYVLMNRDSGTEWIVYTLVAINRNGNKLAVVERDDGIYRDSAE